MSIEDPTHHEIDPRDAFEPDDRTPLALAAGLAAAVVAGVAWALLVRVTGYEIGYAAWGVGMLVGWAMAAVTRNRSGRLALAAANFALIGLVAGKLFIFLGSTGVVAAELTEDEQFMRGAFAWRLYEDRELDAPTLAELDATIAAGDTLSDAVWSRMLDQAGARLGNLTANERTELARNIAQATLHRIGPVNGVFSQLSGFDLLWILLAVGTAYRLMSPPKSAEPQSV